MTVVIDNSGLVEWREGGFKVMIHLAFVLRIQEGCDADDAYCVWVTMHNGATTAYKGIPYHTLATAWLCYSNGEDFNPLGPNLKGTS